MSKHAGKIYPTISLVLIMLTSCLQPPVVNPERTSPPAAKIPQTSPQSSTSPSHLSPLEHEFIITIRQYLGVPYKWGGADKAGMDCSGLVITVYRQVFDMRLPHNSGQLSRLGTPISRSNLALGDLVFFRTGNGTRISHVGIYLAESNFVHASSSKGVTISNMATNPYYVHRFVSGRRIARF